MSIGWFVNIAAAIDLMYQQRFETSAWDGINDHMKEKVIYGAYNRLYHSPQWNLPTFADAGVAELVVLQIANAEMAVYMIIHLVDEDRRKGLQAQGVIEAGIEEEKYEKTYFDKVPIPATVIDLLKPWAKAKHLHVTNIDRDEDYGVAYPDVIDIEE